MATSLNIYLAVDGEMAEKGEQSELIVAGDRPPEVGEEVDMGLPLKKWQVINIEAYRSEGQTVYIATVTPCGSDREPDKSEWEEGPVTMHISLAKASDRPVVITYGWNFNGKTPSGRIYGYKLTEEGIEPIPLEWVVCEVETCRPDDKHSSLYEAIHLCWCESKP
ncbi:hypothetical protein [Thermoleptolyngbya sp.]